MHQNILAALLLTRWAFALSAQPAGLILHGGKIVTVDERFSIHSAIAVRGSRILKVGPDEDILKLKGPQTTVIDLHGRLILPGLIDSHMHPVAAAMTEYDHELPAMETIQDVLDYIGHRAQIQPAGHWIIVQQVFITRLREQRYPSRSELDRVAPKHPVMFRTGPDASLNSLALQLSGIDRHFQVRDGGSGFIEKDVLSGEPTGILRNCSRYVKIQVSGPPANAADRERRLGELLRDYNAAGLTSIGDRDATEADLGIYRQLRTRGELTVRVRASYHIETIGSLDEVLSNIRRVASHPLVTDYDEWLRVIGIKTYLDGGMLTGSAYLSQPWGVSGIYAITDPDYRGVLFLPKAKLAPMVRTAVESGLQFTAHSVGDGAVETLLEVYAEVNRDLPIQKTRPCISHSNFMSQKSVERLAELGVSVDVQPAWLYLDAGTLLKQFGQERLRWFQPLRTIFEVGGRAGGGSDHMQKIGSLRSVNPYHPFLGMATAITRRAKWQADPIHPEEALNRQQAIRFYTINNAWILFADDLVGSLEPGKLADFIILDRDILSCPAEDIAAAKVIQTYLAGRAVFSRN